MEGRTQMFMRVDGITLQIREVKQGAQSSGRIARSMNLAQ
jgi:hypothetical protein